MYRQGDVFLVSTNKDVKKGSRRPAENSRVILAHGEATGHHHSLGADVCDLFDPPTNGENPILEVYERGELVHQEHNPIVIPKGVYFVVRQREYSPEEVRYVID